MNLSRIEYTNYDIKTKTIDKNIILHALNTSDDILIDKLNAKILTPYQGKINLIEYLLTNKSLHNTFNLIDDVYNFFKLIAPLSNKYNLGSFKYDSIIHDNHLFIHNSIAKYHLTDNVNNFIEIINNHFDNLQFYQYCLKNKRYNKTLDYVFVFKIDGNLLVKK